MPRRFAPVSIATGTVEPDLVAHLTCAKVRPVVGQGMQGESEHVEAVIHLRNCTRSVRRDAPRARLRRGIRRFSGCVFSARGACWAGGTRLFRESGGEREG